MSPFVQTLLSFPVYVLSVLILGFSTEKSRFTLPREKLKTASLVQESLRNLLLATEDSTGQEDAELLGHIVNWETGLHPRKRWKVGGR